MENEVIENGAIEEATANEEAKIYTQEEVLTLLQSESDKRVSQALKTQVKKYEKQLSLSKLDGDERAKAEKDNYIAELEERLAQYQIERNKSEQPILILSKQMIIERQKCFIYDSRGFSTIVNVQADMIDYVKLTCYIGDERPTADGKYNFIVKGNYFNSSFGAQENTLSVKYRWKIAGETFSEWQDMADIASERVLPVKSFFII